MKRKKLYERYKNHQKRDWKWKHLEKKEGVLYICIVMYVHCLTWYWDIQNVYNENLSIKKALNIKTQQNTQEIRNNLLKTV